MIPWFEPWMGGLIGGAVGLLGGVYGTVVGICAPRGIAKPVVLALHFGSLAIGISLLIAALIAWSNGQPGYVIYSFTLPGLILSILMIAFTPLIQLRYRQAEERKMSSMNLS